MSFTFNTVELCVALCSLSLIGLLQGSRCCMMTIMMVIIGMVKIDFLSGNEKPKKPQQKKSPYPLPDIHQDIGIGVCWKMKKRDRKIIGIYMGFLCLMTRYKNKRR